MSVNLIQFSVQNFKSFRNKATLSFVARKDSKNKIKLKGKESFVFPSTMIFGPNASGKSSLLEAMHWMDFKVGTSHFPDMHQAPVPFKFDSSSEKPTSFEIIFSIDGMQYSYIFSTDINQKIVTEALYEVGTKDDIILFKRNKQKYEGFKREFKEKNAYEIFNSKTKPEALFLSVARQWGVAEAEKVFVVFQKFNALDMYRQTFKGYTKQRLREDNTFRDKIVKYLKIADFCIEGISFGDNLKRDTFVTKLGTKSLNLEKEQSFFYHKNLDSGELMELGEEDESEGTRRFLNILGPIIGSLEKGEILAIDELDNSLHHNLVQFILFLFNNPKINKKNAQILFTTHDITLLSEPSIDRDQFWFTEKNKQGISSLFSLGEFKEKKDVNFLLRYLDNRYGAIPFVDYFSLND